MRPQMQSRRPLDQEKGFKQGKTAWSGIQPAEGRGAGQGQLLRPGSSPQGRQARRLRGELEQMEEKPRTVVNIHVCEVGGGVPLHPAYHAPTPT